MATKNKKTKRSVKVKSEPPKYKKSVARLATLIKLKNTERVINTVVGGKGTGKTEETKKLIKKYIKKYPNEKVLIIDACNEYGEYPKITIDKITEIKKPSRVCLVDMDNETRKNFLKNIGYYFRGGLLVIEDFEAVGLSFMDNIELVSLFINCSSKDIDIIISFQSIKSIPIKIMQNTSVYRFHKTYDISLRGQVSNSKDFEMYLHSNPYALIPIHYVNNVSVHIKYPFVYFDSVNQKIISAKNYYLLWSVCVSHYNPLIEELCNNMVYGENK